MVEYSFYITIGQQSGIPIEREGARGVPLDEIVRDVRAIGGGLEELEGRGPGRSGQLGGQALLPP
jgi:hypothetical protein